MKKQTLQAFTRMCFIPALAGSLLSVAGCARVMPNEGSLVADVGAQQEAPDYSVNPEGADDQSSPLVIAQDAAELKSEKEKQSYALGVDFGNALRKQSSEVDMDLVMQGVKDTLSGSDPLLTEEEVRVAVHGLQNELKRKQSVLQAERVLAANELAEKNKKDGEAFLTRNKTKEGVVTLESGLQYKILNSGDGTKPTVTDTVVSHYRGTLIDGAEFADSYKSNQPATFVVRKVIPGWREALQLMPVGSKWQLFIPTNLAYGARGAGRTIAPNATLIFEVELIAIKDTDKADVSATQDAQAQNAVSPATALSGINVAFKLDPRLTQGLYMGERWVSPPTYTSTSAPEGEPITVEARAQGRDTKGRPTSISPNWIAGDPEMVAVSPSQGSAVTITVKRAGETSLQVASQGVSKELAIKAVHQGNAMQVEISQN